MKLKQFTYAGVAALLLFACKKNNTAGETTSTPAAETAGGGSTAAEAAATYLNIPYATTSAAQKLDIHIPATGTAPYPVLIWIHGGGWSSGDKSTIVPTNRFTELQARGYAVVSINYRLSGEAKFPAQIYDVKAAIRWIKANAATYQFNPAKIGVWGSSAGGHLTALAGTSGGVASLEDLSLGNASFNSRVNAVVDWYGPTNFLRMDSMALAQGCASSNHNSANSAESQLIGYQITTRPDLVAKANPINYVTTDDPPFFIEHGRIDCTVAYGQSQILYARLLNVLGPVNNKLKLLDNTGHGGGLFNDIAIVKEAVDFLDVYLK